MKMTRQQLLGTALRACIVAATASTMASAQTVDGSSGVDMGGTGNITGAPHITFPSTSGGALTWSSAALQGFVIPAGQLTGITTAGGNVAPADLLPIQSQSLAVVAPSGAIQASLTTGGLNLWNPTAGGGTGALETALSYSAGGALQSNGSPVVTAANIATVVPNAALWQDAGTYLRPAGTADFRIDEVNGRFASGTGALTTGALGWAQVQAASTDRSILRGMYMNHTTTYNTTIATGNTFGIEGRLSVNVATGVTGPSSAQIANYGNALATGAGTTPLIVGLRGNANKTGTGIVNEARALEVFAADAEKAKGIYIGTITGSVEANAIYSASGAPSYFTGNIGIGRPEVAAQTAYPLLVAKTSGASQDLIRIENQDQSQAIARGAAIMQIAGQVTSGTSVFAGVDFKNYDHENGVGSEYTAARILAHGGGLDGVNDGGLYFYNTENGTPRADVRFFADGSMTFSNDSKRSDSMMYGAWSFTDVNETGIALTNDLLFTSDRSAATFGHEFRHGIGSTAGVSEDNHAYGLYATAYASAQHAGTQAGINAIYANASFSALATGNVTDASGIFSAVSVNPSGFAGPDGILGTGDDTGVQGTITNGYAFRVGGIDSVNKFGFYDAYAANVSYFGGSVGIGSGSIAPEEKLDLDGRMMIRPSGTTAPAPTEGFVIWVDTAGVLKATSSAGNTTTLANP